MFDKLYSQFILIFALLLLPVLAQPQEARQAIKTNRYGQRYAAGHVLVKFKDGVSTERMSALLATRRAHATRSIPHIGVQVVDVPEGMDEQAFVEELRGRGDVEFAEVDGVLEPASVTPNDPVFRLGTQWGLSKIGLKDAWSITTGSSAVTIAIIDTGVQPNHPELQGKLVAGWNVALDSSDTSDITGHGTEVASAAGAITNNGLGIAGVCWDCPIMPIRVANLQGIVTSSAIANGITWAADHGVKIANASFQVTGIAAISSAAQYLWSKGGVLIASAGDALGASSNPDNPAIVEVGSTDSNDALYAWSNTGPYVDLVAPGCGAVVTIGVSSYGLCGTSYSAPLVAGVAGLMLSVNPSLPPSQLTAILKQTAVDLGTAGCDSNYGCGRINALAAVQAAAGGGGGASKFSTTTILASTLSVSTYGQTVTLNASVAPSAATGTITFLDGSVTLGTAQLSGGSAALSTSTLSVGTHSMTASYAGDTNYNASVSNPFVQTVNSVSQQPPSTPTLTSVVATGGTEVDLAWTPSSGSVAGYQVTRNGSVLVSVAGTALSYADMTVSPNTTYTYSIKAYANGGLFSNTSNSIQVTTPAASSGEEANFLMLLNAYRAASGVGPVSLNSTLENSSLWMSTDMAANNYFSHTDSLGRSFAQRLAAFGWTTSAGENIAAGYVTAQQVLNGWKTACDPDANGVCTYAHNTNMLDSRWTSIGISRADNPNSTYGYYWTTDFGGSGQSVSLPSASFNASSSTITAGQSVALSWSVSGANSVSIDNGIGSVSSAGSRTVTPSQTTTYSLSATNSAGTTSRQVTITVSAQQDPPAVSFTASSASITPGQYAVLSWYVTSATAVSIDNGIGSVGSIASRIVTPSQTTTYTLTATNGSVSTTKQVTVNVTQQQQDPPRVSVSATPATITAGQSATVAWYVTGATSVTIDNGIGAVAAIASQTVSPNQTTTYTVTATNGSATTTRQVTLIVTGQQDTTPPTAPVLTGSAVSQTQVLLAWSASSDSSGVSGYQVLRNGSVVTATGASTLSYTDSVSAGTTYTYAVKAFDAAGNMSTSNSVQVTTPAPQVFLPVISSFAATSASLTPGQSTTLYWAVSGASSLSIDNGVGSVTGLTARLVQPSQTTTYTLTASNSAGSVSQSLTVGVASQSTTGPVIASVTPYSIVPLSSTMTPLVIKGMNFGAGFQLNNVIRIGSFSFTSNYSQDGTTINAYLPLYLLSDGTYVLTVTNPNGTSQPYTIVIAR